MVEFLFGCVQFKSFFLVFFKQIYTFNNCKINDKFFSCVHGAPKKVPVAEFKEFERRFKFKPRFKYGWFHLKLYQMFQDLSRR